MCNRKEQEGNGTIFFTCFPSTPHAAAGGTDVPDVVGNSDAAEMAKSAPLKDGSQPSGDESSEGLLHSTECKGIAQVPNLLTTTLVASYHDWSVTPLIV